MSFDKNNQHHCAAEKYFQASFNSSPTRMELLLRKYHVCYVLLYVFKSYILNKYFALYCSACCVHSYPALIRYEHVESVLVTNLARL